MLKFANLQLYLVAVPLLWAATFAQTCKPIPGDSNWPSAGQWTALNTTVNGRLIKPTPPGLVCQSELPSYNAAACAQIFQSFGSSDWHANNPVSSDYNDDTCLPSDPAPCSAQGNPAYVVDAITASHVQAAIQFAKTTGVRLIVKGTGHDFPGRSAGANSLSVWTHNIRGIETMKGNALAEANGAPAAVKVYAGMRVAELYTEMQKQQLTAVSGSDPNVGVMGWMSAGGHGPLTSLYGLGADQVLELEVVTPDGLLKTVNANSNADLFWAMRGGGASTFGVVISITVKAYASTRITQYIYSYNTTSNTNTYWNMAAYFHQQIPRINDAGGMGYYYVTPDTGAGIPAATRGSLYGVWLFPNKPIEQAAAILKPLEDGLRKASWGDPITVYSAPKGPALQEFNQAWLQLPPEPVGVDARLGSWLIDSAGLTQNLAAIAKLLKLTTPVPNTLLGHVVAGPGVKNAKVPGGSNAVLPAWRKAYSHIVLVAAWDYLNFTQETAATNELRNIRNPALKALAPQSGAYVSEGDPTNFSWKSDYYGANYQRLQQIKTTVDPTGRFWCKPCVGYDYWTPTNFPPYTDGVGQHAKQLCRN